VVVDDDDDGIGGGPDPTPSSMAETSSFPTVMPAMTASDPSIPSRSAIVVVSTASSTTPSIIV